MPPPTTRLATIRDAFSWPLRLALGLWTLIGAYDLALSQVVPEEWSRRAPKAWQVAMLTGNLLPWWGWTIGFLVITLLAMGEYAFRRAHRLMTSGGQSRAVNSTSAHRNDHTLEVASHATARIPNGNDRIIVSASVTPAYLIGLFKEHTGIQAKKLIEQYLGKWMPIMGRVHDTHQRSKFNFSKPEEKVAQLFIFDDGHLLIARFSEPWVERIAILRRGDEVRLIGKIAEVNALNLELDDCELAVEN